MKNLFFISNLFFSVFLIAQEPVIQLAVSNPLLVNPAYAGVRRSHQICGRVFIGQNNTGLYFKNNLGRSFNKVHSVAIDRNSYLLGGGLGLSFDQNNFGNGLINVNAIKGIYNYLLPINRRFFIRTALQAGFENKSTRYDPMRYEQVPTLYKSLNPNLYDSSTNGYAFQSVKNYLTLGSGLLFQFPNLEIGLNIQNINRARWAFTEGVNSRKPTYYLIHMQKRLYNTKKSELYGKGYFSTQGIERSYSIGMQWNRRQWMAVVGWSEFIRYDKTYNFIQIGGSYSYRSLSLQVSSNNAYVQNKVQIHPSLSLVYFLNDPVRYCRIGGTRRQFPDSSF